jgi:hypothetical protein
MFGYINQWLPAMTGVLSVATVLGDTAYLPRTGPESLRFRPPPPPPVKQVSVPFPPPFDGPFFAAPAPIALPTPPMPHQPPDVSSLTNDPPLVGPVTNTSFVEFDARDLAVDPVTPPGAELVVSPQMLLKYFANSNKVGTNAAKNAIPPKGMAPLGFMPPYEPVALPAPPAPPPPVKAVSSRSP